MERVVAYGRSLIVNDPEQLLDIVERQARQLLKQQSVIEAHEQQLKTLEKAVAALKEEQRVSSVAPFRIDEKKRKQAPKKPGRKPGHRGAWRQSPPTSSE